MGVGATVTFVSMTSKTRQREDFRCTSPPKSTTCAAALSQPNFPNALSSAASKHSCSTVSLSAEMARCGFDAINGDVVTCATINDRDSVTNGTASCTESAAHLTSQSKSPNTAIITKLNKENTRPNNNERVYILESSPSILQSSLPQSSELEHQFNRMQIYYNNKK